MWAVDRSRVESYSGPKSEGSGPAALAVAILQGPRMGLRRVLPFSLSPAISVTRGRSGNTNQ